MATHFNLVTPVDGSVYATRPYASDAEVAAVLDRAEAARAGWRARPLAERAALVQAALDAFIAHQPAIADELTRQIGRPSRYTPFEPKTYTVRGTAAIGLAEKALADIPGSPLDDITHFIRRVPLGTIFVLSPWNYPYLTAVNAIVPALMAGNTVILKHSEQTALCAERIAQSFADAGLPDGVFQSLFLTHAQSARVLASGRIQGAVFTGSVQGGAAVEAAAAGRFIHMGLELGGNDPVYVRSDADFDHAVENIVDGAFFNSGQSCCGSQRIYVARGLYDRFVEAFVALTRQYRLGDPTLAETTLGPLVRASNAEAVRAQVAACIAAGAKPLIDPAEFERDLPGPQYMAPQVLVGWDNATAPFREEIFGPVCGIMPVDSDEQAVALMNDSDYGLTAAIWTGDQEAAARLGDALEFGTIFQNRCDYLDPELAWTGVKNTGRGSSLSVLGYHDLTRPKSFHLRRV